MNNLSFIVTCGQIIPPGFNLRTVSLFVIGNYGMRGQAADLISKACFGVHFYLKSDQPFGKEIHTCVIITTNANELITPVHDCMPVILSNDQERVWLDNGIADVSDLLSILKPSYSAEEMNYKSGIGPHNGNCQE